MEIDPPDATVAYVEKPSAFTNPFSSTHPAKRETKIYTRTGDHGKTSLYSGKKVSKTHPIVRFVGQMECAVVYLGRIQHLYTRCLSENFPSIINYSHYERLSKSFTAISTLLYYIMSHASNPRAPVTTHVTRTKTRILEETRFTSEYTKFLECEIDYFTNLLPPLRHFIKPSGEELPYTIGLMRVTVREAETHLNETYDTEDAPSAEAFVFVNRLSDYLFAVGRFINISFFTKKEPEFHNRRTSKNVGHDDDILAEIINEVTNGATPKEHT